MFFLQLATRVRVSILARFVRRTKKKETARSLNKNEFVIDFGGQRETE